jgi:Isocitrate lyase family
MRKAYLTEGAWTCSPIKRYAPCHLCFCDREERVHLKVFTHRSGADYADNLMKTVTGGVLSIAAMGKGVMEAQFMKTEL